MSDDAKKTSLSLFDTAPTSFSVAYASGEVAGLSLALGPGVNVGRTSTSTIVTCCCSGS